MTLTYQHALSIVLDQLQHDEALYIGWKANIAMAFSDEYFTAFGGHPNAAHAHVTINQISNRAAERFLKNLMREQLKEKRDPYIEPAYVPPSSDSVESLRKEMYNDLKGFADREESLRRDIALLQQQIDEMRITLTSFLRTTIRHLEQGSHVR